MHRNLTKRQKSKQQQQQQPKTKNYQMISRGGFRSTKYYTDCNVDIPTFLEITEEEEEEDEDENQNNDEEIEIETNDGEDLWKEHLEKQNDYLHHLIKYIGNIEKTKNNRFIEFCYYVSIFLFCLFIWIILDYKVFHHNYHK